MDISPTQNKPPTSFTDTQELADEKFVLHEPEPAQQKKYGRETVVPLEQQMPVRRQTFANTFPLNMVNQGPAPVECPYCGKVAMTKVEFVAGSETQ